MEAGESRTIPDPDQTSSEKLLFLRENMVHLTNQLSMPVIEVALVISKYTRIIIESLSKEAERSGERLPDRLLSPIPIEVNDSESKNNFSISTFPLDDLIDMVDEDRMDILDTLIRTVVNESQLEFIHALEELRIWELEVRRQLSAASGPGGLFSPILLSDDF
tara:strand:- start:2128 stop:2616 length:489 start_codon:yes stop_codon:yes gene_type:complete